MRTAVNDGRARGSSWLEAVIGLVRWLIDRPLPYPPYGKIAAICIALLFVAVVIAVYLFCLVAVYLSIALNSSTSVEPSAKRTDPRLDAALAGVVAAAPWILIVGLASLVAAGTADALLIGLGCGLPPSVIIGWQVATWQEARSWSHQRGSLVLGTWHDGPFFVSRPYSVTPGERLKHVVCTGATGSGKSTLIRNMVLQDLKAGAGVCVIDPKDDLVDDLLPHIPPSRIDDVILFDATDRERPLGLNALANVALEQRSLAAAELIAVFRRYFADSWGPRLEHIFRHVVLALLDMPGATLLDIPRLLLNPRYAAGVLRHVTNPAVRDFFAQEFKDLAGSESRRLTAFGPILNKIGPWLAYPELRNIIGQPRSSFDLREVMDEGKVLFVRIPQGALGEDTSNLLGALIVAKVQLAAQSRVDTPAGARRPFYLYVDEFQNFATTSFAKIVTEARAFGLGLVCANQFPGQLTRDLQLAMTNNAGTFVQTFYQQGRFVAEVVRREDIRTKVASAFVVRTPPPLVGGSEATAQLIRTTCRERYGAPVLSYPLADPDLGPPGVRADRPAWGEDLDEE